MKEKKLPAEGPTRQRYQIASGKIKDQATDLGGVPSKKKQKKTLANKSTTSRG
jgi:hypothetical protein